MVDANQVKALWIENWRNADLLATPVELEDAGSSSLQSVDAWMDQIVEHQQCNARLVVTIQMHPLMSGSPAEGTTEAGVALLLVPDELAEKLRIDRQINLHRPVRGPFDLSNGALSHCVKWAGTTAAVISGGWQTGLDVSKAGTLRKASVEAGLESRPTDLDTSAGHAGIAAPWLATACAAQVLSTSTPRQIVFAGCGDKVDCAVLCLASA
jgi:hypothetical protein